MAINYFGKRQGILDLDLNRQPDGCDSELGFQFGANFVEKQTEKSLSLYGKEADSSRMERAPDGDESNSPSKRRRYSTTEKGKAKVDDNPTEKGKAKVDDNQPLIIIDDDDENLNLELGQITPVGDESEKRNVANTWSPIEVEPSLSNMRPVLEHDFFEIQDSESDTENEIVHLKQQLALELMREQMKREEERVEKMKERMERDERKKREARERDHEVARYYAPKFAHSVSDGEFYARKYNKKENTVVVKEPEEAFQDLQSHFCVAMMMIKKRSSCTSSQKKSADRASLQDFKWVPTQVKGSGSLKRDVPSLLELSLNALAKNAEAMMSLEHVPDLLRHKLSNVVCDKGKMDACFVDLLASGVPTEIRVKDCSKLEADDFTRIFGTCNTKLLTVLQLDLCGNSLPDNVLCDTLARSTRSLPALAAISLSGAYRLTDIGLTALAGSAPALQSVNLSHCPFLTSTGIIALVSSLESILRELNIDHCQNIDAMVLLPSLKKLKCLEVLSMAGNETVCDDFVIEMVKACGLNIKELVFAECVELTDIAFKSVGLNCSRLCALDLSFLCNLTNSTMHYLADGCRSIRSLKLQRNSFSDEAIAAFLEVSGDSLAELSLNNIKEVGLNTAFSLAKCSRNLLSLDLSWCRRLSEEALGFIVDSCSSLRLLKLFGCTQITDFFLNGHSNSKVQIIGLQNKSLLDPLEVFEPQQAPLRYSPLIDSVD